MTQVYGEEFRREAVRLALTSGLTRERVAADLGIGKSTLGKWIQLAGRHDGEGIRSAPGNLPTDFDLLKENERLRHENKVLREEREILKKATAFFASQK
ncbi:transposase [Candidatus Phycosocius spiralis]|uniref:Transposase n=1 Tax=Candidatus Phycosocius spiralis TaxID=2815099 RepID=A0ABQ4PVY4_9PROT|nr:transposase [Candidatus Phycosocius spiralis]